MDKDIIKELELSYDEEQTLSETDDNEEEYMEDIFESTIEDIEEFDEDAWNKGEGFKLPNYKIFTEKLEGLDTGLYLFAGPSNHGKSAIMMNLMYDASTNEENNLFGLYFSLDDSKKEIIPRLISMDQRIPIGAVSKPTRYMNMIEKERSIDSEDILIEHTGNAHIYENYLRKREIGIQKLKDNSNRLKVVDTSKIVTISDMYNYIKKVMTYLHAIDENYKLLIAIDSINDVYLGYKPDDGDKLAEVSRIVKRWTVEFDCPIFASTHIRKLNGNRRPSLDDLKDSTVLVYEASVVFIVYNDVSANKEGANIYQTVEGMEYKQPIIELNWAKNKKSSYKGITFCFFRPEFSSTIECDEESIKRFTALLHEAS